MAEPRMQIRFMKTLQKHDTTRVALTSCIIFVVIQLLSLVCGKGIKIDNNYESEVGVYQRINESEMYSALTQECGVAKTLENGTKERFGWSVEGHVQGVPTDPDIGDSFCFRPYTPLEVHKYYTDNPNESPCVLWIMQCFAYASAKTSVNEDGEKIESTQGRCYAALLEGTPNGKCSEETVKELCFNFKDYYKSWCPEYEKLTVDEKDKKWGNSWKTGKW